MRALSQQQSTAPPNTRLGTEEQNNVTFVINGMQTQVVTASGTPTEYKCTFGTQTK